MFREYEEAMIFVITRQLIDINRVICDLVLASVVERKMQGRRDPKSAARADQSEYLLETSFDINAKLMSLV